MRVGERVGHLFCGLCVLAVLIAVAPVAEARTSFLRAGGPALRARDRALQAYRHDQALLTNRRHKRDNAGRGRIAVVGGVEASIEQIPWQAAMFAEFEREGKKLTRLCGGSIVDMSHILTAAHCAIDPTTGQPLAAASFVVVAGASKITAEEIEKGPTVQARVVQGVRVHPDFSFAAGPGTSDDVAVLVLKEALKASPAVKQIGMPSSASAPPESTIAKVSGYGVENPSTQELNDKLYSLGMAYAFPRRCGAEADALFLCASNTGGSACNGDSGGPVVESINGLPPTLVGVIDAVELVEGQPCRFGALNAFANLAAPEIRSFIEGSETPPLAPRGGGVSVEGVIVVGHALTCEPGTWTNFPSFTYAFIDSGSGQILQQLPSRAYTLTATDVGRTIYCEVLASNAGGTGLARTYALPPIKPAPPPPPPPPPSGGSTGPTPALAASTVPSAAETPAAASGGVLGSTATSIGPGQIAALLRSELTPSGKTARIAALLKAGGYIVRFTALEAGMALLDWYQLPRGARLARASPVLVAVGRMTFSAPGTARIKVKLTAAGRALLRHARSLKLTAKGVFTPSGQTAVDATKAFLLKP